jgi:cytidylate kinase
MGISIAIDGPAGSGKSTIAKILAKKLDFFYLDSGAFYRAVTYYILKNKIDLSDKENLKKVLNSLEFDIKLEGDLFRIFINGEDVTENIRSRDVTRKVSEVAAIPEVRERLNKVFRGIAKDYNIVMEGRDIGTVVLPEADFKFFLTASAEERARRRLKELEEKGEKHDFNEILEDIKKRDKLDSEREIAPLKKADGAIEIDTTNLDIDGVVNKLMMYFVEYNR